MVTYEDLVEAYYDCRVHKSRTINCIKFSLDVEGNILDLMEAINKRTYQPKRSICFVVSRPKYREVFAADFSDRIIHHYIRIRLEPLLEAEFNDRTFNCRKDKGTLAGIRQLKQDIIECSENYSKDCYVATIDIQGFFMSIPKLLVEKIILDLVKRKYHGDDKEDLGYLCHVVLSHSPEKNCIKQSSDKMWEHLPPNKSLFTNGEGRGMPIGNLPSQIFANYLLNLVDWTIEIECGIKYHGRYVDDMYLVDQSKERILKAIPIIRRKLEARGLTLSTSKFYMQHYSKGVDFTGAIVKPGRSYPLNRIVTAFNHSIQRLNECNSPSEVLDAIHSINSYLGLLIHHNTYAIRQNILRQIEPRLFKWIYIKNNLKAIALKKKYHPQHRIKERLFKRIKDRISLPYPITDFDEREDRPKYIRMLGEYQSVSLPSLKEQNNHTQTINQ